MGLEPTTFELEVQRANPLRHGGCFCTTVSPTFILFYSVFLIFCGIHLSTVAFFFCKNLCIFAQKIGSSCCLLNCSVNEVICIFIVNIEILKNNTILKTQILKAMSRLHPQWDSNPQPLN